MIAFGSVIFNRALRTSWLKSTCCQQALENHQMERKARKNRGHYSGRVLYDQGTTLLIQ